jgi:hypothetical protein
MLFREQIDPSSANHMQHKKKSYVQNSKLLIIKVHGTHSYRWDLNCQGVHTHKKVVCKIQSFWFLKRMVHIVTDKN